jgi:anoctamin-10
VYYLIKVSEALMNEIAHEEKMMVFNLKEGIICRFMRNYQEQYENFHHRHVQEIILKLMNDEFDLA